MELKKALQNKNTLFFVAFYNKNPVGRTLINAFVKYCKENKISPCYLWPDGKSAEQVYHEAGFRHFSI